MNTYRIALMPGDGVGVDVMEAAETVLDALDLNATYIPVDIGWALWCREGDPLPQRSIDTLKTCTCALFGAVTSKPEDAAMKELRPDLREKGLVYRSPIVRLRQIFDLYTNLRPCKALPGNPLNYRDDIDLVIFRENTEGLYAGLEFHPLPDALRRSLLQHSQAMEKYKDIPLEDLAVGLRIITRKGARRILQKAFDYADRFGYPSVTLVEKPNVLRKTSGLMVHEARSVASGYPDISLRETNVDAQMMWLLKEPEKYGVMVASNLFGDILSDLAAQLIGGLGFAASANMGDDFAVFEPTHGSAPKYAGQYKVNPTAMLLTVKLMLDWLGETKKATALEGAVSSVVLEGRVLTYDMGGHSSTLDMARAVAGRL